jgi:hypothetical protein
MQEIETLFTRMLKSGIKYRFVIDMASLRKPYKERAACNAL